MEVSIPKLAKMVWLIIVAYVLFFGSRQAVAASESRFEACASRNCGSGPNISFPFYVENAGADFCGIKGFGIECWDGKPIYNTTRGPYVLSDIFYSNHSLRLVDLDVYGRNDTSSCLAPRHYFIFDEYRRLNISFRPDHANLQFFYNCTNLGGARVLRIGRDVSRLSCASNSTLSSSFVALVVRNEELSSTRIASGRFCESEVAVPVNLGGKWSANASVKSVDYEGLLRRGFDLDWEGSESVECSPCSRSGGRCGVHRGFACFCPDGTSRPANCTDAGGNRTAGSDVLITPSNKRGKSVSLAVKMGIIAAIIVGLGFTAIILFFCLKKKCSSHYQSIFFWKKQNQTSEHVEEFLKSYGLLQVRRYSYREIKKMTRRFKEELGKGGFGDVYKGKLEDGSLVAVKVSNNKKSDDDGLDFINEVATISRTSHVNVVDLLGFCFEGAKRALIYEFMPNGSLEKLIFKEEIQIVDCHLIALGIAKGLEYLHRGCNTRIVHFDIKPHNILLDADLVPKISDFGLAKICTKKESAVSMLAPRGTIGYIAPEIMNRSFGEVSHKSDVYSYGMMILEMVGGRQNINVAVANTSEIYFPYWIYKRIKLDEDLGLKTNFTSEDDKLMARKMVIVSLWCIQTDPSNRPTMSKVINMLESDLECLPIPPKPFLSSPSNSSSLEMSSS